MKKIILLIFLISLLVFGCFNVQGEVFGNTEIPQDRVNPVDFKNYMQNKIGWKCQYKRYSDSPVLNGDNYISVGFNWNDAGFWKMTITLSVPMNIYWARIYFGVNRSCSEITEINQYNVSFIVDGYPCFFDWTDLANINGLTFDKGKTNNMFWMSFEKTVIPMGIYVFDPLFGYKTTGFGSLIYDGTGSNYVYARGQWDTCDYYGLGDNITVQISSLSTSASKKARCYLYDYVDDADLGVCLGTTEEKTISSTGILSFDFIEKPLLTAGNKYFIIICPTENSADVWINISKNYVAGNYAVVIGNPTAIAMFNPSTGESAYTNYQYYLYCSYTNITFNEYENIQNCTGTLETSFNGEFFAYANYSGNSTVMWIAGGSSMNINVNMETSLIFMSILIILWVYFITKYYDTKRKIFAIVQFGLSLPLCIEIALISMSYVFGYVLVFGIPIIGLYIIIDGLLYNKKKKENE